MAQIHQKAESLIYALRTFFSNCISTTPIITLWEEFKAVSHECLINF